MLAFFSSLAILVQTLLQTTFILDASCRYSGNLGFFWWLKFYFLRFVTSEKEVEEKPGRQVVTFLLVCNLAMWMMNTLETNRADSHPIQAEFFGGHLAWPIITHISMPLAIFYRSETLYIHTFWKLRITNLFSYVYNPSPLYLCILKYGTFQVSFHCLPIWNMEEILQVWKRNICIATLYVLN